ncbi:MAG: type II secretion system protein [Sedimentisphaerales bacterium]
MKTETFKAASKNVIARSPFGTTKQSQLPRGLRAHPTRRDCRAALAMTGGIKNGFTLAELLTAIAIIAILIGVLMPALNMARKFASDTKQKAMLASIETGILMYKNDNGEYPPSHGYDKNNSPTYADYDYCGAQTLAEALLGQDLLGFHPSSKYEFDAYKSGGSELYYDSNDTNLRNRKGPYLNRENIGVFKPKDIFDPKAFFNTLEPENYLICDVYTAVTRDVPVASGTKKFKIGTPILYFRADTSRLEIDALKPYNESIYNFLDNQLLVALGKITNTGAKYERHLNFLSASGNKADGFYDYITDDTATTTLGSNPRTRPVRPDSFLLISAGADGFYGTTDDICNFTPNIQ